MGKGYLTDEVKIVDLLDHAEGSADRNSAVIDMAGFDGCAIFCKFGDIAAGATTAVKAQQGAASDLSDAADLEGTSQSVAADDDNQLFVIDIQHPRERYLRLVVDKDAANNTEEMAWALLYRARTVPISQPSDVNLEQHNRPAEGTA